MTEVQVWEGDGIRPLPTTVEDAIEMLEPLLMPYRELNIDADQLLRGKLSDLHKEAFEIVNQECQFNKNHALRGQFFKKLKEDGYDIQPPLGMVLLMHYTIYMMIYVITKINYEKRLDFSQWVASIPKGQISSRMKEDMAFQAYCLEVAKSHG